MNKKLPNNAKKVFEGEIFDVWQWEQEMFDGSTATFEKVERRGTAVIIATVGDKVVMQKEQQPDTDVFPDLPSGRLERGEDPLHGAQREFLEETGYTSDDWELWKRQEDFGKVIWPISHFIARDCKKIQEPELEAGEKITNSLITFDELIALTDDPAFRDPIFARYVLEMRLHPEKMAAFKKLLFG